MPSAAARRQPSPQSVTRVIRILEALCASGEAMTLAELSRVLGSPKSSLSALLRGLADEDFVVASEGAWRLGPGAFGLGSALLEARKRLSSSEMIRQAMRRLAERTGETVLLAVRDEGADAITYVEVIQSAHPVRFAVAVGDRRPLYATAGGRALLAAGPEADAAAYLARLRPERLTAQSQTDRAEIAAAIASARETGFAQTVDQAADGVTGSGAAIRDAEGRVLAALVVGAPSSRADARRAELAQAVCEEAALLSRSLGFRG